MAEDQDRIRIERVSETAGGIGGNGVSFDLSISANGRYVAFQSWASNLVEEDTNGIAPDVFVKDLQTGVVTLASTGPFGQDDRSSRSPSLSADGRFVAFESFARNLVAGDTNAPASDIFVKDLQTGAVTLVSTGPFGQGNSNSEAPAISADDRYVAFQSFASNLVEGDANGVLDVFVKDLQTGAVQLVSQGASGLGNGFSSLPAISADIRLIAFYSAASNLVEGDTNGVRDVFVKDVQTGAIQLVSRGAFGPGNGESFEPAISADGRWVAFASRASNLVEGDANGRLDVFIKDLQTGAIQLVSSGVFGSANGDSGGSAISADGRYVAFSGFASNLVEEDTNGFDDIFVKDLQTGEVTLVSRGAFGLGNRWSFEPEISADGHTIAFMSYASNLVPGDTNGEGDVFVARLLPSPPARPNTPPLVNDDAFSVASGIASILAVLANDRDPDGDSLRIFDHSPAQHGTVTLNVDGTLRYTSDPGYGGADVLYYRVSDGRGGIGAGTVNLTVTGGASPPPPPANRPPLVKDDALNVPAGAASALNVLANDRDPDGDVLRITDLSPASHGVLALQADGTVRYTPDAGFSGTDVFYYQVQDGRGGIGAGTVQLSVGLDTLLTPVS